MLKRYWGIVVFALALASGPALGQNVQPAGNNAGSASGTQQGDESPNAQPVSATAKSALDRIANALEAANDKPASPEEADHARRDLAAQEDMAKWAKFMLGIGAAEIVVTFVGLVLIYLTFNATRGQLKAAQDGNEIARTNQLATIQQLRAYVGIKEIRVSEVAIGKLISFDVVIINSGQTVARNLRMTAGTYSVGADAADKFLVRDMLGNKPPSVVHLNAGQEFTVALVTPNAATADMLLHIKSGAVRQVVGGHFSYEDVFGALHRGVFHGRLTIETNGHTYITASGKHNRTN